MSTLVYDLEIARAVPPRNGPLLEGVDYCSGWGDRCGMGVAVVCAFEVEARRMRVFGRDDLASFLAVVEKADVLVTFNGLGFDDPVLRAVMRRTGLLGETDDPFRCRAQYDLLRAAAEGHGRAANPSGYAGLSLDAIIRRNPELACRDLDDPEALQGAHVPIAWQRGQVGRVVDYCLSDVGETVRLYGAALANRALHSPVQAATFHLPPPPG